MTDMFDGWSTPWLVLGTVMHVLACLLVVVHCLLHRREPTSALLWWFVAWSFPFVGPLLFIMFGVTRLPAKGAEAYDSNRQFLDERKCREQQAMPLAYWRSVHDAVVCCDPETPLARMANRFMDRVQQDYPLLGGNQVTPLVSGDEAFPRMLEAIARAEDHVHLQTFILADDPVGRRFLDALRARAGAGVQIRLLYDRFGSTPAVVRGFLRRYRGIPNLAMVGWTQANPLRRQFQVNLRNHRKLMVVDGQVAFTGGINLDARNESRPGRPAWRDYHFEVRGPIVQELQYGFLRDWFFMTNEQPAQLLHERHFPHVANAGDARVRVVSGGPAEPADVLTDIFFNIIAAARRQVLAVTPYFVPTSDLLRALRCAALRGVDVRLLVPARNNHVYAGLAGRALYETLLEAGVRIFERGEPFLHAKALIVDDELVLVGSSNLDSRSLRLNYETNLAVSDRRFLNDMKQIVLADFDAAKELFLAQWLRRPLYRQLLENFCSLMTPVL